MVKIDGGLGGSKDQKLRESRDGRRTASPEETRETIIEWVVGLSRIEGLRRRGIKDLAVI